MTKLTKKKKENDMEKKQKIRKTNLKKISTMPSRPIGAPGGSSKVCVANRRTRPDI